MVTSKLTATLQILTKEEWNELHLFLLSPYHNRGKEAEATISLFVFFQQQGLGIRQKAFTKETIYLSVFKTTLIVNGKLEKLMGRLYRLVCEFIVLREHKYPAWLSLAAFYRLRKLPKLAAQQHKAGAEAIRKAKQINLEHYWLQLELDKEIVAFNSSFANKHSDLALPEVLHALDLYYLLEKLKYACWFYSQANHENLHKSIEKSTPVHWIKQLLPLLSESPYLHEPGIESYHAAFSLLDNTLTGVDRACFEKLETVLAKNANRLSEESKKSLQAILRIHVVGKYNQGYGEYLPLVFRMYQQHLANGELYYDGKILPETVMNIVMAGLRSKAFVWVYDFIQTHRGKVTNNNATSEECYHFNMAYYHFHIRQFDQAELLLNQDFQNFYYKAGARRLELLVLYEQQSELLNPRIEAFKMFIFRLSKKQIPEKHRQLNNHFIDFLRQIIHPSTLENHHRIEKLKTKITQMKRVAEREWLLEKLEDMR